MLDPGLNVVDGVGGFHLEGNGFAGEGLDKDLHTSTETKDEMESIPSECALRRGSSAVGQVECLPCPGSWP